MEELVKLTTNLSVHTSQLSLDKIQDVLINAKRQHKSSESNLEEWSKVSELLWIHIQIGLDKLDDQFLCATCFFTVIILTDKQEMYVKKMHTIIENEISSRSTDSKDNSSSLQAVSLMYGLFQSAFLTQTTEKSNLAEVLNSSFKLLTLMGYEYSQYTFMAFKTMYSFKKLCDTDLQGAILHKKNIIKLLNLVNHNWENPITGVRDLNKGIFKTLVSIIDENILKCIIQEINSFYWNKAKYLMLSEVIENCIYKIFESNWIEGLINSLHKPGLVSAGADMYYAILKKMSSDDEWCKIFLYRIVEILKGSSKKAIENFCNYWLLTSLKKFPILMNILINELEKFDETEHKLYSIIFLMKQGNKLGILNRNWDSTSNFTKSEDIVLSAIEHSNAQIRILAFDIICISQDKLLPSAIEYSLVLDYIKNNINSDCTVLRLSMLGSLNGFLSHQHILFRNMKDTSGTDSLLDFCKKLQQFLIKSLNLNGNYQRKSTNVKLINTIIDAVSEIPKKRKDQIKSSSTTLKEFLKCKGCWMLHDKTTVLKLISLLKDPSEDIRDNSGKLLFNHYSEELKKTEPMNSLVQNALQSMKSKFFFEISCGRSMFKLIVNLLVKENHDDAIFKSLDDIFNYGYSELMAEYKLNRDVLKSIEDGKQLHSFISILQVVLEACIRNSYKLNIPDIYMTELINVLQGVTNQFNWEQNNATSFDFSKINDMVEDIIAKSGYNLTDTDETKISGLHQIVLNCLWLNVKASCDLASLLINYHKEDLEKCEKCLNIITHVLETSRHKGAIEAAGTALGCGIQLLTSLPEDSKTSKLPQNLLKTKLDILILEASKMTSITRRGAGLSIMVHRIVSSDMQKGKPLFHYFMRMLLKTCQNTEDIPSSQDNDDKINIENQMDLPKAIFIHFLTKIVTDSSLASDLMFYSAELAEIAFSNLTSPHWQIRNAALQLYGALIPKLIGQKKASGTDDETIATVACDELRTHSPKLWKFIIEQLKNDTHSDKINAHSNLVPILNMLASCAMRYNFSYDSKEQLTMDQDLLNSLIRILDSPIHTVRRLTARCIFNIFSFQHISDALMKVDFGTENFIHGALMLLNCCYKYYKLENSGTIALRDLNDKCKIVLQNKEYSYWSQEVYTSIHSASLNINDVNEILVVLDRNSSCPGVHTWAQTSLKICIMQCPWDGIVSDILCVLLNHNNFEIHCEILLCKIESQICTSEFVLRQTAKLLISFEKNYQSTVIWKMLYKISLKIVLNDVDVGAILKDLDGKENSFKFRYIIPFAARLFINMDEEQQNKLANTIYSMCDFENTDVDMRYIAALANNELPHSFYKIKDDVKVASLKTAIILLQDEDEDVRNVSVLYYKNMRNLKMSVHPNICLNKILDCNFLRSIIVDHQFAIELCKDLLHILSNNLHNNVDEYNPFANDSKNIYLEVDVLQQSLKNLLNNFE